MASSKTAMASSKKSLMTSSRGIFYMLGFIIVYQFVYHVIMWHALDSSRASSNCELGLPSDSPQCLELQVFKAWKAEIEQDSLEVDVAGENMNNTMDVPKAAILQPNLSFDAESLRSRVDTMVVGDQKSADLGVEQDRAPPATTSWTPITAWARGVSELQAALERRMEEFPSVRRARKLQRKAEFDKLYNETLASIRNRSYVSPWATELQAIKDRLQAQMDNLTDNRQRLSARAAKISKATTTELPLIDRIHQLGRELCEEPHRRNYTSCVQFLRPPAGVGSSRGSKTKADEAANATAEYEVQMAKLKAEQAEWERLFKKRADDFGRILCSDPRRRGYSACLKFSSNAWVQKTTSVAAKAPQEVVQTTLRGAQSYKQALQVSPGVAGVAAAAKYPIIVGEDKLRSENWQDKLPKVGCITTVQTSDDLRGKLGRVVNQFYLQTYPGPRQLLLVYHYTDTDVADIVKEFADGTYIKAVPARSGFEFPATSDLRFGAWISDADIIARWDFDDNAHPDRLAMQVRSLSVTGRPASVLLSEGLVQERTLVGDASWMQKHWMPLLDGELELLNGVQAPYIAQVDMPSLVEHGASGMPHGLEGILQNFALDASNSSVDDEQSACTAADTSHANKTVQIDLPIHIQTEEFVDTYHQLKTEHSTLNNILRVVCDARDVEDEFGRRVWLSAKAGQIAAVQRKVNTHFNALASVVHGTSIM